MDLKIREFETALRNYIDSADVPAEVKRLIVSNIAKEAEEKANAEIVKQFAERESKEKSEKEDKEDEQRNEGN